MSEKFFVTGGCGFVGTWVIRELLGRGASVVAFDVQENRDRWDRILGPAASRPRLVKGNLTDRQLLSDIFSEHEITHVIHLGALLTPACQEDPWEGCYTNVLGSVAIFEQIRLATHGVVGFSYASSLAVFGPLPDGDERSHTETDTTNTPSFYGAFKRSVEIIAQQYWQHFEVPSIGIRPHVIYGPERTQGLTAGPSLAVKAAAAGHDYVVGYSGAAGYDFVDDVVRAFVRGSVETPRGSHVVDLPSEQATPEQIIAAIQELAPASKSQLTAVGPPIPSNVSRRTNRIEKLYPDWRATSLKEGLAQTLRFYGDSTTSV